MAKGKEESMRGMEERIMVVLYREAVGYCTGQQDLSSVRERWVGYDQGILGSGRVTEGQDEADSGMAVVR